MTQPKSSKSADSHGVYTHEISIGIICALPVELKAVKLTLDAEFKTLAGVDRADENAYTVGRIGQHNVAIACLPTGRYGTVSAASVARDMARTFPSMKAGLMIGIGGGIPSAANDIRLGDIVVSKPSATYSGVIQYDLGRKQITGFERTGQLNGPPLVLLTALSRLEADHKGDEPQFPPYMDEAIGDSPKRQDFWRRPTQDRLFKADYPHPHDRHTCDDCEKSAEVNRRDRTSLEPAVHYGIIASGNAVIKDAHVRDDIGAKYDALCFEMEAAGLMNTFPCLVIRGICDYSDSHKNKDWQPFAALAAAAFGKELLDYVTASLLVDEKPVATYIPQLTALSSSLNAIADDLHEMNFRTSVEYHKTALLNQSEARDALIQRFHVTTYAHYKDLLPRRHDGTCGWITDHIQFNDWLKGDQDDILWITADPGMGKSVLTRALVDTIIVDKIAETNDRRVKQSLGDTAATCYFFFREAAGQDQLAPALCSLLHQIFSHSPRLIDSVQSTVKRNGDALLKDVSALWSLFLDVTNSPGCPDIFLLLDALDECQTTDRNALIAKLCDTFGDKLSNMPNPRSCRLRCFVTSRPYIEIESAFSSLINMKKIRIYGEKANEVINKEINTVIRSKVDEIAHRRCLSAAVAQKVYQRLVSMKHRTYLWLSMAMEELEDILSADHDADLADLDFLPASVEDAYEKILRKVPTAVEGRVRSILAIMIASHRPLTIAELRVALLLLSKHAPSTYEQLENSTFTVGTITHNIEHWCARFVFIRKQRIYFIHQTAKEFILGADPILLPNTESSLTMESASTIETTTTLWRRSITPSLAHLDLLKVCIDLLRLDLRSSRVRRRRTSPGTDTLYVYAHGNWAYHFMTCQNACSDEMLKDTIALHEELRARGHRSYKYMPPVEAGLHCDVPVWLLTAASLLQHSLITYYMRHSERADASKLQHATDSSGKNLLHLGSSFLTEPQLSLSSFNDLLDVLLRYNFDINARDSEGNTALHMVCKSSVVDAANSLLARGADADTLNQEGQNPLHALASAPHTWGSGDYDSLVHRLLGRQTNPDIDTTDLSGRSYLVLAADTFTYDDRPVFLALLKRDADLFLKDAMGTSAWSALRLKSRRRTQRRDPLIQASFHHLAASNRLARLGMDGLVEAARLDKVEWALPLLKHVVEQAEGPIDVTHSFCAAVRAGSRKVMQAFESQLLTPHGKVFIKMSVAIKALCRAATEDWVPQLTNKLLSHRDWKSDLFVRQSLREPSLLHLVAASRTSTYARSRRYVVHRSAIQPEPPSLCQMIDVLVQHGANVNDVTVPNGTALHVAVRSGMLLVAEKLLKYGARQVSCARYGTPLHVAVAAGNFKLIGMLLEAGAKADEESGPFGSVLCSAVNSTPRLVRPLYEHMATKLATLSADPKQMSRLCYQAVRHGYIGFVKDLKVDAATLSLHHGFSGNALHAAVIAQGPKTIRFLLEAGMDVNADGPLGTPLCIAATRMDPTDVGVRICRLLLQYGADPNILGPFGTPLQRACGAGSFDLVVVLLAYGARVNMPGPKGAALHIAASRRHASELIKLLLRAGGDPQQSGPWGSPLQSAVAAMQSENVAILLRADASLHDVGKSGTPLQSALNRHNYAFRRFLRRQMTNPIGSPLCTRCLEVAWRREARFCDHLDADSSTETSRSSRSDGSESTPAALREAHWFAHSEGRTRYLSPRRYALSRPNNITEETGLPTDDTVAYLETPAQLVQSDQVWTTFCYRPTPTAESSSVRTYSTVDSSDEAQVSDDADKAPDPLADAPSHIKEKYTAQTLESSLYGSSDGAAQYNKPCKFRLPLKPEEDRRVRRGAFEAASEGSDSVASTASSLPQWSDRGRARITRMLLRRGADVFQKGPGGSAVEIVQPWPDGELKELIQARAAQAQGLPFGAKRARVVEWLQKIEPGSAVVLETASAGKQKVPDPGVDFRDLMFM